LRPLIDVLKDESVFVRMGAADVLVSIGEAAVDLPDRGPLRR